MAHPLTDLLMARSKPGERPKTIICDIDDTLDLEGSLNVRVAAYLRNAFRQGFQVIVLTNRIALRQPATVRWLSYWRVPFHKLIMRPLGATRPSPAVKAKAYREQIAPYYDVVLAIDNLHEPWTSLGVPLWFIDEGSNNKRLAKRYDGARF